MSDNLPARGEAVRWNGAIWIIHRLSELSVELRNVTTGERENFSLAEWTGGLQTKLIERRVRPCSLGTGRPHRNAFMRWKDATWRVTVVRKGIINLINVASDEVTGISLSEWQKESFEGKLEMVTSPDAHLDSRTREILSVAVDNMPPSMRKKAVYIALFLEAWRNPTRFFAERCPHVPEGERNIPRRLSKRRVQPFLSAIAAAYGVKAPSFSGFCKWLAKVTAADGDLRAAVARHDLQGPKERYMNPRVEQWLNEIIDKVWLTPKKAKKLKVHDDLETAVEEWNEANPDRRLTCPTAGHVARYIREEVDRKVVAWRRGTKEEAERAFGQRGKGIETSFILERVEVDHTLVRINVLHDETRVNLGYPWITAALEHQCRMPLAAHLNFESQSLGANFQCLRQAVSPKGFLPKLVPELDYNFPSGVPFGFFFDRGSDYDNDSIRLIGQSLDIIIDYEPAGCPEYKGAIERWWRTLKEDIIHGLPGASRPGEQPVAGVDADGQPYITYSELVRRMWLWISMVYAKSYHRGIQDIPLRRWQELANKTLPRALRKKDDLNILLTHVAKCPVSVNGVTFEGLTWKGEPLVRIMAHPSYREGMEVNVRFDEYDVSQAWVINPFTLRDEKLTPRLAKYMAGLSFHAHDRIRKNVPKSEVGAVDERLLRKTRHKLDDQANDLIARAASRKGGVSPAVAKFLGVGQKAPHGDHLEGVWSAAKASEDEAVFENRLDVPSLANDGDQERPRPTPKMRQYAPRRVRNHD